MNSRQRTKKILDGELPDRVGITDSFWKDTIDRWYKEGISEGTDPRDYFETDFFWMYLDPSFLLDPVTIADINPFGLLIFFISSPTS